MLSVRSRGRAELARGLEQRGFTRETAAKAAARLESEGWLDDLAAARSLVRIQAARYGKTRIERELKARGFARETVALALAAELPDREAGTLTRAFEKLWTQNAKRPLPERRRRVHAALTRRGFAPEAISAIMRSSHEVD